MRTRVVRMFRDSKGHDVLAVQQWAKVQDAEGHANGSGWKDVKDFDLDEGEQAMSFAMNLTLSKKAFVELAVYEDGQVIP